MDTSSSTVEARRPPVLLAYGFRPFFLLAALYAVGAVVPWVLWLAGVDEFAFIASDPTWWHAHEMLFGFAAPIIAGFLLTAVPTWTKTTRVHGAPLAALVFVWLAGRAAMWSAADSWIGAAIDLLFVPALAVAVAIPLIRARAYRNLFVIVVLLVFTAANGLMHVERQALADIRAGLGMTMAIDLIVLLMVVIGGRIIPAFTTAALKRDGINVSIPTGRIVDRVAIAATVLFFVFGMTVGGTTAAIVAALAAVANAARMVGWHSRLTLGSPILWVLHLGYAWIVVGLALRGGAGLGDWLPGTQAAHGLAIGAIGTMTIGVMCRVALGHTGRTLQVGAASVAAFALISAAAAARIVGPLVAENAYSTVMSVSGLLWTVAWALFLVAYTPILTMPRVDGRPG